MEIVKYITRSAVLVIFIALILLAVFNQIAPYLVSVTSFSEGVLYYTSLAFTYLGFFIDLFMIPSFCLNVFIALYGFIFAFNFILISYTFIQTCYDFIVNR